MRLAFTYTFEVRHFRFGVHHGQIYFTFFWWVVYVYLAHVYI